MAKAVALWEFKKAVMTVGKMEVLRVKVNEVVENKRKAEQDALLAAAVEKAKPQGFLARFV